MFYMATHYKTQKVGHHCFNGPFFNYLTARYVMICVNDILIIIGSILKELIELQETSGDLWNFCSVFLGTGSILVWIGMLRYD